MKFEKTNTKGAHSHSANHREEIEASSECGCFYCEEIFPPRKISEWCDEDDNEQGSTALCPHCGIDSVIGDASGYDISKKFLAIMHKNWFS
ncbi:cytoplasmic protein [Halomonas sp. ATBC28]|nr:cytoplasmic protein [Halomonas sp. ATBC28]